jgi:hypothetical protein
MNRKLSNIFSLIVFSAFVSAATTSARAQIGGGNYGDIGATKVQEAAVIAGIAGVGAGIGVGVYFLIRHDHTITGCAVSGPNGLVLQSEGDPQSFDLVGVVSGIKPEMRVRVSGKKKGRDAGGNRTFLVEKLAEDFGPCQALAATP